MKLLIIVSAMLLATGCAGATGDIHSDSEIIQAGSYISCAIVTHAVISFFR